jgi:hypothetical protein
MFSVSGTSKTRNTLFDSYGMCTALAAHDGVKRRVVVRAVPRGPIKLLYLSFEHFLLVLPYGTQKQSGLTG